MVVEFTIPGKPVPAVRMTQKSMHVNKLAKRYLAYKRQVGWIARSHMQGEPTDKPVLVNITFYIHGNRRGDLDNLFKGATDSLNKIVYKDDKQIRQMKSRIVICEKGEERTEIQIYELDLVSNATNR